jgi:hypothetical protein
MAKHGASRGTTLGHSAENTGRFPDLEITLPDHARTDRLVRANCGLENPKLQVNAC